MIVIPSNEIKQPRLHADSLGFTFVWNNHFLRGIYPSAVEQAKYYFESGFINEVVSKKLFPKTWISEFENEQFGMILEHEMITPVLYAMEWNFDMLKDAALMVLEIAQIGWKYGYNMVDCHKLNVLFLNNHPMYVDLGSFVLRKEGETGWRPYSSFLRSYYSILDVWKNGASQIAKRMMAPGTELNSIDYYIFKKRIYRLFPALARKKIALYDGVTNLAGFDNDTLRVFVQGKNKTYKTVAYIAKKAVGTIRIWPSQNLCRIERKIRRMKLKDVINTSIHNVELATDLVEILPSIRPVCSSVTIVDCHYPSVYEHLLEKTNIDRIISINQVESCSVTEYNYCKGKGLNVCSSQFPLLNNSISLKGKFPENRLSSDVVIVPEYRLQNRKFSFHNAMVFFERCQHFSKSESLLIQILGCSDLQKEELSKHSFIRLKNNWYCRNC